MLYPHGSNTNSSMSAPCSRSAMPLLTVVCCADTNPAPLQNWAACEQDDSIEIWHNLTSGTRRHFRLTKNLTVWATASPFLPAFQELIKDLTAL